MEKGRTRKYGNAAQRSWEDQLRLLLGDTGGQNVKNIKEMDESKASLVLFLRK